MKAYEKDQADERLQQALELDVEKEVERQFALIKQKLEDSQNIHESNVLESARSAIS